MALACRSPKMLLPVITVMPDKPLRRKYILVVSALLLSVGAASWSWHGQRAPATAPAVTFSTLEGERIAMQTLSGRPALVAFWASDCASCLEEMPHLVELYRRFNDRGLALIGVAMAYDPPHRVLELARRRDLPYPVALDLDGALATAFGNVSVTPTTFLIAPDGAIVGRYVGRLNMPRLRRTIMALLPASEQLPARYSSAQPGALQHAATRA